MKTIDLSIDFDFFVREDPMWDFGHSERMLHQMLWPIRYRTTNLYPETDMERFADFLPRDTLLELSHKGLKFHDPARFQEGEARQMRQIGVADSHSRALEFFQDFEPADQLISLDAHHDLFNEQEVDCGNWLVHLMDQNTSMKTTVIYPGWKESELDGEPVRDARLLRWEQWSGEPAFIRHIFLCRSGAWVPPHHDPQFMELVAQLSGWGQLVELEPLIDREEMTPDRQQARQMFEEFHQQHEPFRQQGRSR